MADEPAPAPAPAPEPAPAPAPAPEAEPSGTAAAPAAKKEDPFDNFEIEAFHGAYDELKLMTHWGCCNYNIWWPDEDKLRLLSCNNDMVVCCCSGTQICGLITKKEDIDECCQVSGVKWCISIGRIQELGCKDALWGQAGSNCICCFVCKAGMGGKCHFPHFETCASNSNFICKYGQNCCCLDHRCSLWVDRDVPVGCSCCGHWFKEPDNKPTGFKIELETDDKAAAPAPASDAKDTAPAQQTST